MNQVRPLTSSA